MHVRQIQHCQEKPLQRLHEIIDQVCRIGGTDAPCHREAVFIVKIPQGSVEAGRPFLQNLLEGIGHAELPVYDDLMPVPHPQAQGLHYFPVPSGGHRAQIVLVVVHVLGRRPPGKVPAAGLSPGSDDGIRRLAEEDEDGYEYEEDEDE